MNGFDRFFLNPGVTGIIAGSLFMGAAYAADTRQWLLLVVWGFLGTFNAVHAYRTGKKVFGRTKR